MAHDLNKPTKKTDLFLQPISALMEYCAMQRHTATFREVPIKNYSLVNKFANECSVDDMPYPQGTGKTKKDAKTNAAFIAFNIILGEETFEDYGEGIFARSC